MEGRLVSRVVRGDEWVFIIFEVREQSIPRLVFLLGRTWNFWYAWNVIGIGLDMG